MLKFDELGWGPKVNPNAYAGLLNEVRECKTATLHLTDAVEANEATGTEAADATDVVGSCRIRHAGNGHVAEGHFAYTSENDLAITVKSCKLTLTAEITRTIPEGATTLDLSDLFTGELVNDTDVTAVGGTISSVTDNVVALSEAAPEGGVKVTVNFVLAEGTATTNNNAETVTLDAGDYQIHFIARARTDVDVTRMPNPTMMEFVKSCRKLHVGV